MKLFQNQENMHLLLFFIDDLGFVFWHLQLGTRHFQVYTRHFRIDTRHFQLYTRHFSSHNKSTRHLLDTYNIIDYFWIFLSKNQKNWKMSWVPSKILLILSAPKLMQKVSCKCLVSSWKRLVSCVCLKVSCVYLKVPGVYLKV